MMWWNDGMGWGGWIAMTLVMVSFWALLIFGLMAIFRGTADGRAETRVPSRGTREFLDERFARGEIDADEYQARKEALRTHR